MFGGFNPFKPPSPGRDGTGCSTASSIKLPGSIDRPQTALAESALLVLPSLAEGFGLVLIEAMAAGLPVIATDVAGIHDVVRPNETGLLVPPGDASALAMAISRVITD